MKITKTQLKQIIKEEIALSSRSGEWKPVDLPTSDIRNKVIEELARLAAELKEVNRKLVYEIQGESQTDEFYEDAVKHMDEAYTSLLMAGTRLKGADSVLVAKVGVHPDQL